MNVAFAEESNLAIPPGETLREELRARHMTQRELAQKMGRPVQVINEICQGKKEITAETALELERTLGIKAYIWMNLEAMYRLALARRRSATGAAHPVSVRPNAAHVR